MIGIFWRLVLGALPLSVDGGQLTNEFVKERLCSYYVAISDIETQYKYEQRWLLDNKLNARQEIHHPSNAIYGPWGYDIESRDLYVNYRPIKLPSKFLQYDVFLVYGMDRHGNPYKLGIDDEYGFFKFNGFSEKIHNSPTFLDFKSYNDALQFTSADVPKEDDAVFRDFVYDWIQLTQYNDYPSFIRLISNGFTIKDDAVSGSCRTVQLDHGPDQESKVVYKDWQYKIPSNGPPELKLVDQKTVDDDGTVFRSYR